jgi:glycerophosphoryl diester phosphodiesterase
MRNIVLSFYCIAVGCNICCSPIQKPATKYVNRNNHFEWVKQEIKNPSGNSVLVAVHRGDWRNAPENSIQALNNAIEMGADIMEFDIRKTKDGHYIVLHDDSLDRCTTGKGRPNEYTLEEIMKYKLKDGLGIPTNHSIPTFEEMMIAAKGRIVVNIDKGYQFFPDVVKVVEKLGMVNQSIINVSGTVTYDSLQILHPYISDSLILMPVININKSGATTIIDSYMGRRPVIYQLVFNNATSTILKRISEIRMQNGGIWFNSLWPHLSAGHNDGRAVEENQPDETWGWLVNKKATIIQTDRPKELLNYLRRKKKHP